jgi:enediyne polyketide synthase
MDDIAIVGMACRFPDADNPGQLWQNVLGRRRSFRPMPAQRLPLADYGGNGPDETYLTHAALLDGWAFDRGRFRIPAGTYRAVDPAHWLALEVSADALADAGLPDGEGADRSRLGVVLGNSLTGEFSRAATLRTRWPFLRRVLGEAFDAAAITGADRSALLADLEQRVKAPFPVPSDESLAGALSNTIAGRICNHFDFHGTGYTVDAACASSLVAVATAATAVARGELDVALTGGVDLSLDPFELVGFARVGALAGEEMRVFDAEPTGFLPGEGCGMVVLCRASYAAEHHLRVYARLTGWATSSDGSGGLTRPELAGQRLALTRAYRNAGVEPGRVELLEGHGTGTAVGDATELATLIEVRRGAPVRAALGSVKANIGHTKAAAGIAGLIKATMAVHQELIPPTTGCVRPHPLLAGADVTFETMGEARPWLTAERYAAVNAMGFGGINTHVVLAGAAATRRRALSRRERRLTRRHPDYEVVVCTADRGPELARRLTVLRSATEAMSRAELVDLAAAQATAHHGGAPFRFATAVRTPADLAPAIDRALAHLAGGGRRILDPEGRLFLCGEAPLRVGLLLSGQAAPVRPGAGAVGELLESLPAGYRDRTAVPADRLTDTATAQPLILRASLAGLRWLDALGARADAAVGHSLGELAALVWAGALTEDEAYALVETRGAAMAAAGGGVASGMAGLATGAETAAALIVGTGAVLAADNSPGQVVVSGRRDEVAAVLAAAGARGVTGTWLPVSHAFHSPLMAPAAEPVREAAARVAWRKPNAPVASTVTGDWWDGADPAGLLVRQLTEPVRFRDALALIDADLLVEVGPGHILSGIAGGATVSLDVGAGSAAGVATATAALFAAGACDSVEPYVSGRAARPFDPATPRAFLTNPCEAGEPARPLPAVEPRPERPAEPPPAPELASGDLLQDVITHLAGAVDLDPSLIGAQTRLLGDLHLTSIRVSALAAEIATALGRSAPAAPLSLATASVQEFAAAVADLPPIGEAAETTIAGVAAWVRAFGHHRLSRPPAGTDRIARDWTIVGGLTGHPLEERIRAEFPASPEGAPTRLLALPPGLDRLPLESITEALRDSDADGHPLVVLHHGSIGGAVGRSLAAERPDIPVLVIETPDRPAAIAAAAAEAHQPWQGFAEALYNDQGDRSVRVTAPLPIAAGHDGGVGLEPGDVCVVTGGAKGIGAECAAGLAAATGATMVLIGRSPAGDAEVRAALARIPGATYRQADLTDRAATAAVLGGVVSELGPVRLLVHAAGINEPAALRDLTGRRLADALGPKGTGFDHVVGALDSAQLRAVVAFGSVIGTTGLAGAAGYAIANDWLARRCTELAAAHPSVRWLNIEWSAWSGVGMGVRLGALDDLQRRGLQPIPVDTGVDLFLRLLATPDLPPTVLVTGRLPEAPTLLWAREDPGGGRFVQTRAVLVPGVELVADAAVSLGADPYLADHRIDGAAVLPAVLGLEAMAQAAAPLGGPGIPAKFSEVRLAAPITVPERGDRTVRIAALTGGTGVDLVVRSDETGMATDHFTARYSAAGDPVARPVPKLGGRLLDGTPFYGPVFFHGPRFRRVLGYHGLSAYQSVSQVVAEREPRWFGGFQPQGLELGDPGARDALLHLLQACVPGRRVLPVGAERVVIHRRAEGLLTVDARQHHEDGDDFVFDVVAWNADGEVVEEWQGLALRAVGPVPPAGWPADVAGAHLTRSLRRWRPEAAPRLAVAAGDRSDSGHTAEVASWLTGQPVERAGDGRLVVPDGTVSASHLGDRVLVAAGPAGVAVDWQWVEDAPPLDRPARAAADELARLTGDRASAATRLWTCREVLVKRGLPPDAPVVVDSAGPDGWALLRSGPYELMSTVLPTAEGPLAVCVGAGDQRA